MRYIASQFRDYSQERLSDICTKQCRAYCCREGYLLLREEEKPKFIEMACERGKKVVFEEDNEFRLDFAKQGGRCPLLGEHYQCLQYDNRPVACQNFPHEPNIACCRLSGWSERAKVFVGTIHSRETPTFFLKERDAVLASLMRANMLGGTASATSCRVDLNRNKCIQAFLQSEAEYLLFLDDDMLFPPDVGIRLAKREKDVVCGLYFQRDEDKPTPHWYRYSGYKVHKDWGNKGHMYRPMTAEVARLTRNIRPSDAAIAVDDAALLEMDAGGAGCTMIHRSVLEKMKPPWFRSQGATNGDLMFFYKARKAGFKVWGDTGVICGHLALRPVGLATFHIACRNLWSLEPAFPVGDPSESIPAVNTKEYWDEAHTKEASDGSLRSYKHLKEVVQHILATNYDHQRISFADFGCGRTVLAHDIAGYDNVDYIGLDHSDSSQADNRRRIPTAKWIVSDVAHTPLKDNSIDITFANSVVEHLDDPQVLTEEMYRVTKPRGLMVLGIPLNMPHKEHTFVYDWNAVMALTRRYNAVVQTYFLRTRAIVAIRKVPR